MTLLDRLRRDTNLPDNERVQGHRVENAMKLYLHGHITRTQIINFFNIPTNMEADFDQFKTKYDTFPNNANGKADKIDWILDLEACIIGIQGQDISKTQFNNFLGLSLDEA